MMKCKIVRMKESILLSGVHRYFWDNLPDTWRGYVVCKQGNGAVWKDVSDIERLNMNDAMTDANNMLDDYLSINRELITICDTVIK